MLRRSPRDDHRSGGNYLDTYRTTGSYIKEVARVLRPGGKACIHHSARRHRTLWAGFLMRFGGRGRRLYQLLSMPRDSVTRSDGWKSNVSKEQVAKMAKKSGLLVDCQVDRWGDQGQFRVHVSSISLLMKPSAA